MQYWWESLENDSLLRVLQANTLRLVLVLTIQSFNRNVFSEGISQVLDPLDGELNIYTNPL